jgi:hypothetical protein
MHADGDKGRGEDLEILSCRATPVVVVVVVWERRQSRCGGPALVRVVGLLECCCT